MTHSKDIEEELKEILRNHTASILWPDPVQQLTAPPELLKRIDKEVDTTAKYIIKHTLPTAENKARADELKRLLDHNGSMIVGIDASNRHHKPPHIKERITELEEGENNAN